MSKRQTDADRVTSTIMLLLARQIANPDLALGEAIRKAVLSAYHSGYSRGLQDNLSEGLKSKGVT